MYIYIYIYMCIHIIYIHTHTHRHTMLVSQIPGSFPRFELTEIPGAAALGAVHPASCVFNDDSESVRASGGSLHTT